MAIDQIRFNDGAAYERYMGKWSQLAGEIQPPKEIPCQRFSS